MVTIFFLTLFGLMALTTQEPTPLPHSTCTRTFQKIGCFKHDPKTTMFPKMLLNNRDLKSSFNKGYLLNWNEYGQSIHSLACVCSSIARKGGYKYFAIRFYGECWTGTSEADIQKMISSKSSKSNKCVNPKFEACNHQATTECAGSKDSDYVYLLKSEAPKVVNGGYSQWSKWSSCSATCDEGTMSRERTCTNPKPVGKGKDCSGLGASTQVKTCRRRACKDLTIKMISTGCDSKSKKYRQCTRNPTSINVNGKEYTSNKRGFNCIVLSAFTGTIEYQVHFDTYGSQSASNRFAAFLNSLSKFRIVLCTVKDEATRRLTVSARDAVARVLRSRMQLQYYRAAYVFAGYTGPGKPGWVQQKTQISRKGPLYMEIPVTYVKKDALPKEDAAEISLHILSTGCNDPGKYYHKCTKSPNKILYNGKKNLSSNKRGFNVAVINILNGKVEKTVAFDTYKSKKEANKFADFLNGLERHRIVAGTVKDEAKARITYKLKSAMKKILGQSLKKMDYRGAYAFVGYTGPGKPYWVRQVAAKSRKGPVKMELNIPLYKADIIVSLTSTGCNDPGKYYRKCYLSPNHIMINGKEQSKNRRGFNIAVVDLANGKVVSTNSYDTYKNVKYSSRMTSYLNSLKQNLAVFMVVKDEGAGRLSKKSFKTSMKRLVGSTATLAYRGAYCAAGATTSTHPLWAQQIAAKSRKGPVSLEVAFRFLRTFTFDIKMISAGYNDYRSGGLSSIKINGKEYSQNRRGVNVVVLDRITGLIISRSFDTYRTKSYSNNLVNFIKAIPSHRVILISVKDEATRRLTKAAKAALMSIGARKPFLTQYRSGYLLVGFKGRRRYFVQQKNGPMRKGLIRIHVNIS